MSHSIIPPSSAGIWGAPNGCTGWVVMAQSYPDVESEPAREGTAAHEIAEAMIRANARAKTDYPSRESIVGQTASNNVVFTDEMYDGAERFADDVLSVMTERGVFGGDHFGVEHRVEAARIHAMSYGTVDCFLFDQSRGELFVWDFKFGYGVVEVYENWQLINYVAGILDQLGINGAEDQHITVRMRIVQPRAYHRDGVVREWSAMASGLRGYFNQLHDGASRALGGSTAEFRSGEHCKHCTGRHACPAALKAGVGLYEVATQPTPVELSAEAAAVQYSIVQRARKQLEYLESGLQEQIKGLLTGGAQVPGYRLEPSRGRERWSRPIDEVIALGDLLGHDLRKVTAITPKQAVKLGVDESVIKEYSETPNTGVALVADNGNKAKQVFK